MSQERKKRMMTLNY